MKSRHLITLALTLPVFYWIYLLFFTQTEIKWDSFDYEHLGQMIIQQGWAEFFRTGPNREPLYPFFLSLVMRLSDFLDIPYLKIMSVLQFTLLFITQCLTLKILQKLNIKPVLCALTVFYIGISPVLINCALSLYSEILIIALIPAAILIFSTIFSQFPKHNSTRIIFAGLILALTLLVLTFTKAIFEIAGPAILLSSFLIVKRIAPSAESFKRFAIMILIACIVFGSILFGYKSINKHFNNNFTLTNRGAWAFYGFAARRLEPITTRQLMAGITFIPGEGACKKFFTEKECYFWSFYTSDYFGIEKLKELMGNGFKDEALDKELMHLAITKIKHSPFQYTLLTSLEGLKIFFWESTKLGFVIYPEWLMRIYDNTIFKDILRLLWAIFSLAGSVAGIAFLFQKSKYGANDSTYLTIFLIVSFVFFYTAIYSLFQLGTRYAVPVGPLFICLFAIFAQRFYKE